MYKLRARVFGRVQKVMYRDFIKRKARNLNIKGYVQNLKDGSVIICACADKEALDKLLSCAKKGSLLAKVEKIDFQMENSSDCIDNKKFYIKF